MVSLNPTHLSEGKLGPSDYEKVTVLRTTSLLTRLQSVSKFIHSKQPEPYRPVNFLSNAFPFQEEGRGK